MPNSAALPNYDEMLVLSELEPAEINELREWYCHTKPIGPSIRIRATSRSGVRGFGLVAAGHEPGPAERVRIFSPLSPR
jgi:hypothetical protein